MKHLSLLNKFFTLAIVFTMINLNVAINVEQARVNISAQQAYASQQDGEEREDERAGGSNQEETSDDGKRMSGDGKFELQNAQDSDNANVREKRKEMSGTYTKDEGGGGLLGIFNNEVLAPVIMLAIAYVLSRIWIYFKPTRPGDVMVAAVAGGILLVNELMSAFSQTESFKDRKSKIEYEGLGEDGQVDISQKQMLEEEKSALEELKDTTEKKAKFEYAASAAFAIASILAVVNANTALTAAQLCTLSLGNVQLAATELAAAAAACGVEIAPDIVKEGAECAISIPNIEQMEVVKSTPAPSSTVYPSLLTAMMTEATKEKACGLKLEGKGIAAIGACTRNTSSSMGATSTQLMTVTTEKGRVDTALGTMVTECSAYLGLNKKDTGSQDPQIAIVGDNNFTPKMIKAGFYAKVLDLFFGKAHASMGNTLAVLVGLIAPHMISVGAGMSNFMLSSNNRAWLWGGFGATALLSASAKKEEADTIQDNIDKIDAIIKKFKSAGSVTTTESKTMSKKTTRFSGYQAAKLGAEMECIGGLPKIATNNGSKACPSAEKYIVDGVNSLNGAGFKIPDSITGSLINASNGIQDTSSISPSTQANFENLGKAANALNKKAAGALKKLLEKSSKFTKKKNQDRLASLGKNFGKLNKSVPANQRTGGLMSALPYLMDQGKSGDAKSGEAEDDAKGLAVDSKGGEGINNINTPKADKFKFDFGADDAEAYAMKKNNEFAANADAVANMKEEVEGEIIEDKSVDIWKAISVRYKKTAYDRLLKRIE